MPYLARNKNLPYFRRHHASGHVILTVTVTAMMGYSTGCDITSHEDSHEIKSKPAEVQSFRMGNQRQKTK